jgi:hypothetical protein
MEKPVFKVRYRTWAALGRDVRQQIAVQGLLLKKEAQLNRLDPVTVRLTAPDESTFELEAEVVQVIPGQGVAVQFKGPADELVAAVSRNPPPAGETPAPDDPEFLAPGEEEKRTVVLGDTQNLQKQIEEMSVNQKRTNALHGRKQMRMLLIRDRNKTIHPFVIKNPAITLDEIEQIAKMPSVNPDVLRSIAKSKEWTRSTTVCRNLVRNPKTPMKEALMLLVKLPLSDLRAMAKSGNVRTAIQQAARKKVAG